MTLYLSALMVSLVGVGLKAGQQLNVMHGKELWVIPVSYFMSFMEVLTIKGVANQTFAMTSHDWLMVLMLGTGAWVGTITAIRLHRRFRK